MAASTSESSPVRLGDLEVRVLDAGDFFFDGGAMFGAVPKVLWSEFAQPDEQNRIRLALTLLLVTTPTRTILVDAGFGTRITKRMAKIYGCDPGTNVETALASAGRSADDIDVVVLTHLHVDHAGGATKLDGERVVPAFPNATYVLHRLEWEAGLAPDPMNASAYRRDDFVPLEEAGSLELIGDRHDLGDGVTAFLTGGHTIGHLAVLVETPDGTLLFPGDLIPSRHHLRTPYVAAVDLFPADVMKVKAELLGRAVEGEWLIVFDHDPGGALGRVARDSQGRLRFQDVRGPGAA